MCLGLFRTVWSVQTRLCSTIQMCCSRSCCILELETFFLLLCNDASSLCQYFNALIDVTTLIVPNNLKWAFKHSYWNIDVLAVWLNHWLQGAVFPPVISGDNLAKTRLWLFYQQRLAKTQSWIKDCHAALIFSQSATPQDDFGKLKAAIPNAGDNSLLKEELSSGSQQSSPFTQPISPIPLSSHSWMQGCSLPRAAIRLLRSKKQCMNHQGMFSVLEWLMVEFRAEFAQCKWELITPRAPQGNLTSGEIKKHPLPVLDFQDKYLLWWFLQISWNNNNYTE